MTLPPTPPWVLPVNLRFGPMPLEILSHAHASSEVKLTYLALYTLTWQQNARGEWDYIGYLSDDLDALVVKLRVVTGERDLTYRALKERFVDMTSLGWIKRTRPAKGSGLPLNTYQTWLLIRHLQSPTENVTSVSQGYVHPAKEESPDQAPAESDWSQNGERPERPPLSMANAQNASQACIVVVNKSSHLEFDSLQQHKTNGERSERPPFENDKRSERLPLNGERPERPSSSRELWSGMGVQGPNLEKLALADYDCSLAWVRWIDGKYPGQGGWGSIKTPFEFVISQLAQNPIAHPTQYAGIGLDDVRRAKKNLPADGEPKSKWQTDNDLAARVKA